MGSSRFDTCHRVGVPCTPLNERSEVRQIQPVVTHLLVEELFEKAKVGKPTARGTRLRYSSSFGCERQMAYVAFDVKPCEPMDHAGAWVTGLGTMVHEQVQEAISRKYPSARFEVSSQIGNFISGSCDALIPVSEFPEGMFRGTHVLWELKTMGTYSFDKQVGWNRMKGTQGYGEGPALKAVAQAGMNALGIMEENPEISIENLILGSITFEALSRNKSSSMEVGGVNRCLAEFVIEKDEWFDVATREAERMAGIFDNIDHGYVPDRVAKDDNGSRVLLNPEGRDWQCDYCQYRDYCVKDGDGALRITESKSIESEIITDAVFSFK